VSYESWNRKKKNHKDQQESKIWPFIREILIRFI